MMMMINAFQIEHKKRITEKIDTKCAADCRRKKKKKKEEKISTTKIYAENKFFNQAYIGN
jgi:hypothetical protein